MSRTLVLIDGTNYAFRAFFAIKSLTNSKGFPTNALHGYANMLVHHLNVVKPDYIAVAFDASGPTFREQRFPDYKAHRDACPPDLVQQMPWFKRLTEALGITFLELTGFEADDIIATLIRQFSSEDLKVQILSMDKDLMQLVNEQITLFDSLRNKLYDPAAVEEKWGVPPRQLRDLLALQGDTSDNVPGVPGVGPKKAQELLKQFGSVDYLLEHLGDVTNAKLRETLQANRDIARLSLELVTLHEAVPLDLSLDQLVRHTPNADVCHEIFRELEFNRLLQAYGTKSAPAEPVAIPLLLATDDALLQLILALRQQQFIAIRFLHPTEEFPNGALFLGFPEATGVYAVPMVAEQEGGLALPTALAQLLEDPLPQKIGHDLKPTYRELKRMGIELGGIKSDMQLTSYLLNPSRQSHELAYLSRILLDRELSAPTATDLVAAEVHAVLQLVPELEAQLAASQMINLNDDLEIPLLTILADMEDAGIALDTAHLQVVSEELQLRIVATERRVFELAGESFNANSPKQLQTILFEKLKLPILKKTKTGPSTDQQVLEELALQHALPAAILEFRSLTKLKNTYVDVLPTLLDPKDGRIHTTFHQTVAATGRLSSTDPNLQNIPIRGEEGLRIRQAFVAPAGFKLLSADYSQIELRLLAHLCEDEALIGAFVNGIDIHRATAAEMFNVNPAFVTHDMRRSAKAINFGILYGMGAFRLSQELKISRKEAESYILRYFERYPKVRTYLDNTLELAREQGYVTTLLARRRYIPDLSASNFNVRQSAERMAINTPIQGSAADIIKLAMKHIHDVLKSAALKSRMILQVHDELVFEVPDSEVETMARLVKETMEQVQSLKVPLNVDVGVGQNWREAH